MLSLIIQSNLCFWPAGDNPCIVRLSSFRQVLFFVMEELMHRGYIKLFRKIRESIIWKRSFPLSYSGAWIDILCEVRHSDKPDRVLIGNTVIECKRGQSIKSQDTWAKRWGWDRSKVRRFFKLLVSEHMVELETTNKTTIITVCKYETYQDYRPSNDHQTTIK